MFKLEPCEVFLNSGGYMTVCGWAVLRGEGNDPADLYVYASQAPNSAIWLVRVTNHDSLVQGTGRNVNLDIAISDGISNFNRSFEILEKRK